ncbi:Iron sulfur cluster assembly protein 1, partial [Diplonema papillatum]
MFFRRAMPMVARSVVGVQVRTKYDMSVIKHFHSPQHVGKLDADKTSVGTGVHGSAACGDLARIQIEYDDKTGLISDAAFKTFGCGSAIAASSYACGALIGKSLNQVLEVTNSSIVTALKLPPVKKHCSLLTEGCVRKAVKDLLKKRPELKEKIDTDRL